MGDELSQEDLDRRTGAGRLGLPPGTEGVLPSQLLRRSVDLGLIDAGEYKVPSSSIQPASLDLRLGEVAYRIRSSFLPDTRPVEVKLKEHTQLTTWMRIERRQSVTIEAAGRTAGRIGVWRDGNWLEDIAMNHSEAVPRQGKAIHRYRMDAVLEPGDYKLVV